MSLEQEIGLFVILETTEDHPAYKGWRVHYSGRLVVSDDHETLILGGWSDRMVRYGLHGKKMGIDISPNHENDKKYIPADEVNRMYPVEPHKLVNGTIHPLVRHKTGVVQE
jgi:hypothetical protein